MTGRPFAHIAGTGAGVPARVVTNHDLEQVLDTSDEWIVERTGIRARRFADKFETLTSYSAVAARQAMANAGVGPLDIDGIVFGTISPDHRLPSAACDLQAALGAEKAWAVDAVAACPGWIYSTSVAEGLMATGHGDTILVVGAEKLTSIINPEDRGTAILFGDGAGASILKRNRPGETRGILSAYLGADGRLAELLHIPGGAGADPMSQEVLDEKRHLVRMAGREVFKAAVLAMSRSTDEALARAGVTADQIDIMIPHQANLRIIEATAKHAGMPMEKVFVNLDKFGNTSAGSVPLALAQAVEEGRVQPGMLVLLVAFGAGFTWGSLVVRW